MVTFISSNENVSLPVCPWKWKVCIFFLITSHNINNTINGFDFLCVVRTLFEVVRWCAYASSNFGWSFIVIIIGKETGEDLSTFIGCSKQTEIFCIKNDSKWTRKNVSNSNNIIYFFPISDIQYINISLRVDLIIKQI